MLRAASFAWIDSQALDLCLSPRFRRDIFKICRNRQLSTTVNTFASQTVLTSERATPASSGAPPPPAPPPPRPPPPPPPPRAPRRAWTVAAAAIAVTASLGGVYFYRKLSDDEKEKREPAAAERPEREAPAAYPSDGGAFPKHVQFLLVGGGTASFAAMRAIRSARPDASLLIVGDEPHPPYMRPPLSKEAWREPDLANLADDDLAAFAFRQWNGKRRPLAYEPLAFYAPLTALGEGEGEGEGEEGGGGGAALARGWTVARLDVARREAELRAPGRAPVTLSYDECLLATGARPRRLPELRAARDAGLALAVRTAKDAARLARALAAPGVERVAVVGGGYLASELSAALAERLGSGRVVQLCREEAPLARVLPAYLARDAERRLAAAGVRVRSATVEAAAVSADGGVELALRGGGTERASLVVECAGAEPATELAAAAGLELHEALGGVVVNAELAARGGVWAAGDAACFHDPALGRRRVEHHDHAVVSGRLAGENMAAARAHRAPRAYTHQSMFWSDLGPSLGYEAIGVIDAALPTVGVFAAEAVGGASAPLALAAQGEPAAAAAQGAAPPAPGEGEGGGEGERRFERGVVFYMRDERVVGVLLWNLFNRMHIARQVLAQGKFDDLFEVAKLFALHEDD